jgi:hypothetical protein
MPPPLPDQLPLLVLFPSLPQLPFEVPAEEKKEDEELRG